MRGTPRKPGPAVGRYARAHHSLRRLYYLCCTLAFDPKRVASSWRAVPYFVRNALRYQRSNRTGTFRVRLSDLQFATSDRFLRAGTTPSHYFLQDLWAARWLYHRGVRRHVDVGSRLDGFIAHVLPFCEVIYVDIRPIETEVEGLVFLRGSATELPFPDEILETLSCLHVIEHIGLGRYGDPVDPEGHLKAAAEMVRVLRPGGALLLGTPVGRERLFFDAHRVFDPRTVVEAFGGLGLRSFSLIDDAGGAIRPDASFEEARRCVYGCGLFVFVKTPR